MPKALFNLGRIVATPAALRAMEATGENGLPFLSRHVAGDFGVVNDEDKRANDRAVGEGSRVFSAYLLKDGTRIWVVTEADRSSTCVLLPSDY